MDFTNLLSFRRLRKPIRFQVMSDLHLEICQQYSKFEIVPCANYLILAGDIGRLTDYQAFRDFLCYNCQKFERVFLVLGNHEFFGVSRKAGLQLADKLQNDPGMSNLVIMNQKRVDLEDITLLGCTLHSHIPREAEEIVTSKVNDFRRIVDWTVADHSEEHARDVKWLEAEIDVIRRNESDSKRTVVVITHHAPVTKGASRPTDESIPWSSAFMTGLIGNGEKSPLDDVQWWVFGHTHHCTEFVCGRVKLVSNQRGYVLPNNVNKCDGNESRGSLASKILSILSGSRRYQPIFDLQKVIEV